MEESFGVIPIAYGEGDTLFACMVQHKKGQHWAFPKGHQNLGETPQETAARELFEEVGLSIKEWLPLSPIEENYLFERNGVTVQKKVTYFFATVLQEKQQHVPELNICPNELEAAQFIELHQTAARATYPEMRACCQKVVSAVTMLQ